MIHIQLNRDLHALISPQDEERVRAYRWRVFDAGYTMCAIRNIYKTRSDGKLIRTTQSMHRFITGAPDNLHVDHINRDGLDNRRENLRLLPPIRNNENRNPWGVTGFRGVDIRGNKYRARITLPGGARIEIGLFSTPQEAARAYDRKALEVWGDYYGLNFPREDYDIPAFAPPPTVSDVPF